MFIDMRANELMIGDWLRHRWTCRDTGREVVKDFQLTAIQKIGESLYAWSKNGNAGNVEDIEPIPLTAEILEKNGFEKEGQWWHLKEKGQTIFMVMRTWDGKFVFSVSLNIPIIPSVHQLQHALRLCKIEKEIEL